MFSSLCTLSSFVNFAFNMLCYSTPPPFSNDLPCLWGVSVIIFWTQRCQVCSLLRYCAFKECMEDICEIHFYIFEMLPRDWLMCYQANKVSVCYANKDFYFVRDQSFDSFRWKNSHSNKSVPKCMHLALTDQTVHEVRC